MAWLQNLSGQAENFLTKIDQKAAGVLKATSSKLKNENAALVAIKISTNNEESLNKEVDVLDPAVEYDNKAERSKYEESFGVYKENQLDAPLKSVNIDELTSPEEASIEDSDSLTITPQNNTISNSYIKEVFNDEYIEKIDSLEYKNELLNRDLLNIQHLYATVENENVLLKKNLERANEMIHAAEKEMQEYKARTHRILKEKEKNSGLKFASEHTGGNSEERSFMDYNEKLKKELRAEQYKNEELTENVANLTSKILSLQKLNKNMQDRFQVCDQKIKQELASERKTLMLLDQDLAIKSQELENFRKVLAKKESESMLKTHEIEQLKCQLMKQSPNNEDELHNKFQSLTQTLIINQRKLETAISERNGLRIQLEALENEYSKALTRNSQQYNINHNDTDDVKLQTPEIVYFSSDVTMTRKFKHAYSCLNALSIKIGLFLRRHPKIRVIIFGYIILLHFWVLLILWNYAPNS